MKLLAMLMMAADLNGQPLPEVVLIDFHAGYCQPCQQMVPVFQRMERDKFPIRKIDITEQPNVSKQYRVDRIPTMILLVEGKEAQRFVGLTSEEELRQAMNDAARKLDQRRKMAGGTPAANPAKDFAEAEAAVAMAAEESPPTPPGGIRGLFDRMKKGLSRSEAKDQLERPSYRAQSPDEQADTAQNRNAMAATVRVGLMDGRMRDFGTGTVVHSTEGQSTILTCAHVFKGVSAEAAIIVEVFRDGEVLKYPAQVIGGDHDSDVAFLQIRNSAPLPTVPIASRLNLQQDDAVFSIGCNNGDRPTRMNMNVVAIDRYEGPENVVCTKDPIQGRSGGGLFNTAGELVGVCSGAFRKAKEGLYSGVKPIYKLASAKNLSFLSPAASGFPAGGGTELMAEADNPFAADDAMFDELMADSVADFSESEFGMDSAIEAPDFGDRSPQDLPDPFAPRPAATTAMAGFADSNSGGKLPTEITVIIDSKDPTKGKKVVVIPRPSPWLLELLTGETTGSGFTTAGGAALSSTSSRTTRATQKVPRPRLLPAVR